MALALCAACGASDDTSSRGSGAGKGGPDSGVAAKVPAQVVGSWYAGAGFTSAPYDPVSGAWGTGDGLGYVFRADGTYTKAFQSYVSSGGCTTGGTMFHSGRVRGEGDRLVLTPSEGTYRYRASCTPSLDQDRPLSELSGETLSWSFEADPNAAGEQRLRLVDASGASSLFRAL